MKTPYKTKPKKQIGLSNGRIQNLKLSKLLLNAILNCQKAKAFDKDVVQLSKSLKCGYCKG
jgi:hypothetical protein